MKQKLAHHSPSHLNLLQRVSYLNKHFIIVKVIGRYRKDLTNRSARLILEPNML